VLLPYSKGYAISWKKIQMTTIKLYSSIYNKLINLFQLPELRGLKRNIIFNNLFENYLNFGMEYGQIEGN